MNATTEMITQPIQTWARFFMKASQMVWSANEVLVSSAARNAPALGWNLWTAALAPKPAKIAVKVPSLAMVPSAAPAILPRAAKAVPAIKPRATKAVLEVKAPARKSVVAGKRSRGRKK